MTNKKLFLGTLATLILMVGTCASCSVIFKYVSASPYQRVLYDARQSFVKILTTYEISVIGTPLKTSVTSSCSGTIVKVTGIGSYVLTADHCANFPVPFGLTIVKQSTIVRDINFRDYDAVVIKGRNEKADIMLLFVSGLRKHPAIEIAGSMPEIGETILNVAQPGGVYPAAGVVILVSGLYSGSYLDNDKEEIAIYSLLAFGGSSGSMILNYRGQLIGLLHSGYTKAPIASRSPTLCVIRKFLTENWNK